MIVGKLDLGSFAPFKIPEKGIHTGTVAIPGGYAFVYGDHSDPDSWKARIWIKAPTTVGQYSAGTQAAAEFLSRQLEELARNPDQQPVYIQLYAGTGQIAHSPAFGEPQDGWYYLSKVKVDYTKSQFGYTIADLDLQYVSPGPPRAIGMGFSGGALATGFGGGAINWLAFPFNSTGIVASVSPAGAEGAVQLVSAPLTNPYPFALSSTIADWSKGGAHVYDVMAAIGSNAVPTDGTFVNTNWIEVFGKDHRFTGDVVLTNGFMLYTFAAGASPGGVGYLWNTNLAPAQWQQVVNVNYYDNAGNAGTVRSLSLQRVSPEEARLDVNESTSAGQQSLITFRLQRGAYFCRLELRPLSQSNTQSNSIFINYPVNPKVVYNSAAATDDTLGNVSLGPTTDYGYAAGIINNSSYPFVAGLLWQDTTTSQPLVNGNSAIGVGDTGGPSQNATKAYGIFAAPFVTPQNLQAEAEGGTLAGGTTAVTDAGKTASPSDAGNNAAKIPNTTVVGATGTFGTAWQPPAGQYMCWFRMRTTTGTNATANFKYGFYNSTDSTYVQSKTVAANTIATAYTWYNTGTAITTPAGKNVRFRFENTGTSADDFFVDEAVLVPITLTSLSGPQDLAANFQYERTTKLRIS